MTVIIGIDPHKAAHTAVAIGCDEAELATVTIRADVATEACASSVTTPSWM